MGMIRDGMESGAFSLILFIGTGILWLVTAIQSHRLGYKFRNRHPEIAAREIPLAFAHFAHPQKVNFFFRRRTVELLKKDPELWKELQRFFWLTIASLVVPTTGFAVMFVYAMMHRNG